MNGQALGCLNTPQLLTLTSTIKLQVPTTKYYEFGIHTVGGD